MRVIIGDLSPSYMTQRDDRLFVSQKVSSMEIIAIFCPFHAERARDQKLAFLTPGISPLYASSRKQIRQTP